MKPTFQYSVLKYRPSYLLDERINIALLFLFADELEKPKKLVFIFPHKLDRINQTFPKSNNTNTIHKYLIFFKDIAENLSQAPTQLSTELKEIIPQHFLVDDANSFFFSEIKHGIYENPKKIVDHYEGLYFESFNFA